MDEGLEFVNTCAKSKENAKFLNDQTFDIRVEVEDRDRHRMRGII